MLILLLSGLGCYDVPRWHTVESESFVVHHREDLPPAADELDALDLHFNTVGIGTMSVPASAAPIHVHLYRDVRDFEQNSPCPHGARACVIGTRVHTPVAVHRHELVHAYLGARCGHSIRLLDEGLAAALSSTGHYVLWNPDIDLAELTRSCAFRRANDVLGGAATSAAGSFVAWLISEFGLTSVLELACALGGQASETRTLREFEERFDIDLSALLELWQESRPARPTAPCPWDPLRMRIIAPGESEEISIVTPPLLPEAVFVTAESTFGRVRWVGQLDGRGGLYQCGSSSAWDVVSAGNDAGEAWVPIDPSGRYLLDAQPIEATATGSLTVDLFDSEPFADACNPNSAAPLEHRTV